MTLTAICFFPAKAEKFMVWSLMTDSWTFIKLEIKKQRELACTVSNPFESLCSIATILIKSPLGPN